MLGKVIKYDMKYLNRLLVPYYLILFGMGGLIRLLGIISKKNEAIKVSSTIISVVFYVGVAMVLVYTLVVVLKRFYDNTYKEEGYLTHTLPIKRGNLIDAKILISIIYVIVGIGVMILALMIAIDLKSFIQVVKDFLEPMFQFYNISFVQTLIFVLLLMVSSYFTYLLMIMAGMSIGQTFNDKRVLWSVVFTVVIYYVSQLIATVTTMLFFFGKMDMIELIENGETPIVFLNQTMVLSMLLSGIFLIAYYVIAKITLIKKLNMM